MSDFIGKTVDRYQVMEMLGKGGMASVYKAFDSRLERYVAIKFIRRDAIDQEIFLKRFEREAKALASLSHPNIVKVLDYGSYENIPYIVMEYIPGGTLKDRLGTPFPSDEAARLILPIARTLDYTHHKNIIHRDVKPANFLIMENGEPMLSDFGIARMMEQRDTVPLTGTGTGIGTPEYMSPEQCRGDQVDQRTDIYSLGVVFYELITGAKPFAADTPMSVLMKQVQQPLPSPRLYVPDLPEETERILNKALAKNPQDRYQTMGQFAAALEKISQPGSNLHAWQTLKKPLVDQAFPGTQVSPKAQAPSIPAPVFNYPSREESIQNAAAIQTVSPKKSRLGWWIGGGFMGFMGCIALAAVLLIGGNMWRDQQNTSITSTAHSLEETISANQALQTREADRLTSTASAVSAAQTREALDSSATALVEEQNRNATSTAQEQSATQNAVNIIEDDFRNAQENWFTVLSEDFNAPGDLSTGNYQSEWWNGTKTINNGVFVWDMAALKGFYHYVTMNDTTYTNFLVNVVCGQTSGHANGETGLVLMQSGNDKYYFTINNTSLEYEFLLNYNGEWTTLAKDFSNHIIPDGMNRIAIKVENNVFSIFINDEFVVQVEDNSIISGEIAIAAGLSNADEQATFEFDYLTVQAP